VKIGAPGSERIKGLLDPAGADVAEHLKNTRNDVAAGWAATTDPSLANCADGLGSRVAFTSDFNQSLGISGASGAYGSSLAQVVGRWARRHVHDFDIKVTRW